MSATVRLLACSVCSRTGRILRAQVGEQGTVISLCGCYEPDQRGAAPPHPSLIAAAREVYRAKGSAAGAFEALLTTWGLFDAPRANGAARGGQTGDEDIEDLLGAATVASADTSSAANEAAEIALESSAPSEEAEVTAREAVTTQKAEPDQSRRSESEAAQSAKTTNELAAAAERYAAAGWHVFPCRPRAKEPLTRDGFKSATTDPEQVAAWWREQPNANIGLVPGPSGLLVLDLDGPDGERAAQALGLLDEPTFEVTTGRGRHLYFRHPGETIGNAPLAPHLDVRADRGYVLAPPSVHSSGAVYSSHGTLADLRPVPPGVLERLKGSDKQRTVVPVVGEAIAEGSRNATLTSLAGTMRRRGMGSEAITAALLVENGARCTPPLPEDEVRRTAASVARYAPDAVGPDLLAMNGEGPLGRALDRLDALYAAAWPEAPGVLASARRLCEGLPPGEQEVVYGVAFTIMQKRFGNSWQAAQRYMRKQWPVIEGASPFEYEDGTPRVRALDFRTLKTQTPYLVPTLIPAGAVGAISADYSMGKTWLVVDLGLSVAFGRPWLGFQPTATRPVVFCIAEGHQGFYRRLVGWLVEHGILNSRRVTTDELHTVLAGRVAVAEVPVRFDHPDIEAALVRTVEDLEAGLVIFDTLGKSLGAEQSENENDTANAVTGMLSRITARTGCTALVTHHTGHTNKDRARGASAWEQGLDFAYVLTGRATDLQAGLPVTLKPTKMRDDKWPAAEPFRLRPVERLTIVTADGSAQEFGSAVLERAARVDVPAVSMTALDRYTEDIRAGGNTHALHLGVSVLNTLAIENKPRVTRKTFMDRYNRQLRHEAEKAGVTPPKRLADNEAKALLRELRDNDLVRVEGEGRRTQYALTAAGQDPELDTLEGFMTWWLTSAASVGARAARAAEGAANDD